MIRTFIAAQPGEELLRELSSILSTLSGVAPQVRWVQLDNIHLTFRFLGNIPENDLGPLFSALDYAAAEIEPFTLEIRGVGAFPNWRYPRVVWVGGGDGERESCALTARIDAICISLGYDRERRPFRPHLTLGRVKFPADAAGLSFVSATKEDRLFGYMDVDEVAVYMSTLRRTGPIYAPMAKFALGGRREQRL